jgi:Ca2+-binding EF-hand superfamily protein
MAAVHQQEVEVETDRDHEFIKALSALDVESTGTLSGGQVLEALAKVGITETDIRLKQSLKALKKAGGLFKRISIADMAHHLKINSVLISRVLNNCFLVFRCLAYP